MATSFKTQQVLRTARDLTAKAGQVIPAGTRVVVMSNPSKDTTKTKVKDPSYPDLENARVIAGTRFFNTTQRGRPRKEGDE